MAPNNRFSLHQVMLPTSYSSFEEDVLACRDTGVGGIGIWLPKLDPTTDDDMRRLLGETGLSASICSLSVVSVLPGANLRGPADLDARSEAMCQDIQRLAPFAPDGLGTAHRSR